MAFIRNDFKLFRWGEAIKIHDLESYTIVQYQNNNGVFFYPYVNGVALGVSAETLEGAIVCAIAYRKLSSPDKAQWLAIAAMKLLDVT